MRYHPDQSTQALNIYFSLSPDGAAGGGHPAATTEPGGRPTEARVDRPPPGGDGPSTRDAGGHQHRAGQGPGGGRGATRRLHHEAGGRPQLSQGERQEQGGRGGGSLKTLCNQLLQFYYEAANLFMPTFKETFDLLHRPM